MKFSAQALAKGPVGRMQMRDSPKGVVLHRDGIDVALLDVEAANAIAVSLDQGFIVEIDVSLVEDGRAYGVVVTRKPDLFESGRLREMFIAVLVGLGFCAVIITVGAILT